MRVRRLGWAGIEIESHGQRAVIDAIGSLSTMERFVGPPRTPLPPPSGPVDLALVTHLHADHTDPDALAGWLRPGGVLLRPAPAEGGHLDTIGTAAAEAGLARHDLPARVVGPWEGIDVGPWRITAAPAVDGFGDPQVSWVVQEGSVRILHAGDTTFHGSWWSIAARLGPFDAVFLPVNGARCDWPHRQPASPLPGCLDPRAAAAAAHLLGARLAVPVHYDTIDGTPVYRQVDDPAGAFLAEAAALGVPARVLQPGDAIDLPDGAAPARS